MIARLLLCLAAILFPAGTALAGPPFVTDDPGILGTGDIEIIPYFDMVKAPGPDSGESGIDASIGIAPGVQAGAIAPLHNFEGGRDSFAIGDVTLNAKFAVTDGRDGGLAIAFAPAIALPTDSEGRNRVGIDLPVWIGIERGAWSLYGGGGYRIDARSDGGDRAFGGLVAHRAASGRLGVGGEIYAESGNGRSPALVMSGIGFDWAVAPRASLIAAGHAILANRRANGRFHAYAALVITP